MENEKAFLTPEELVTLLRVKAEQEGAHPAKTALTFGELRNLLERVAVTDLGQRNIEAAIIGALQTYREHNPKGDGIPAPHLWSHIRSGGNDIPLGMVEDAITALLKRNEIHTVRGGMITTYLPGGDPELEQVTEEILPANGERQEGKENT